MRLSRKMEIVREYTLEKCGGCGAMSKRVFAEGDVLFARAPSCRLCGGQVSIDRIFGEREEY